MSLPKGLILARLQEARNAIKSFFIALDRAECFADLGCDLTQHDLPCLPRRFQLQHSRAGIRDDAIDLFLERSEVTFLPESFVSVLRPRQQGLASGNSENSRSESEALESGVLEVALDHCNFSRVAQVGLL